MKPSPKKGFTLIELLIVVAIIAILAAIAVPNFLEAQTRAKVARVKADQRSLATAMESYAVDWNRPPIDSDNRYWGTREHKSANSPDHGLVATWPLPHWPGPFPPGYLNYYDWAQLTTPISYITSAIKDPFRHAGDRMSGGPAGQSGLLIFNCLKWAKFIQKQLGDVPFFRRHHRDAYNKGHAWLTFSGGPMKGFQHLGSTMNSNGPIQCLAQQGIDGYIKAYDRSTGTWYIRNPAVDAIYDATNGTMSFGYIMRTTKGVITKGG